MQSEMFAEGRGSRHSVNMELKSFFKLSTLGIALVLLLIFACNHAVVRYGKGRVFDDCDAIRCLS